MTHQGHGERIESMKLKNFPSVKDRRQYIEKTLGISLKNIGSYTIDETQASSRHCENMIGITQIPLGIAGPLLAKSKKLKAKSYYIPLATTEGALVASINRGCKAITESGGATTAYEEVGTTRGPVYKTNGINESLAYKKWLEDNFNKLNQIAQSTSSHIKLIKIGTRPVGKYVYVRFYFNTAEAMGMNMVTIATSAINRYIEQKLGIKCISIAGNFDTDKKPSFLNSISGRGKRVWAEALIKESILQNTLKTRAESLYNVWLSKCMIGTAVSGSLGFNAHIANVLSAIFIATGQDPAHVVEGSLGLTTTEIIDKNLYIAVYLPDLLVGTIGGGTALSTQKEALSIMGITGRVGDSILFAQLCAGAVLAGELSLLASLSEGTLAIAHRKLARGI